MQMEKLREGDWVVCVKGSMGRLIDGKEYQILRTGPDWVGIICEDKRFGSWLNSRFVRSRPKVIDTEEMIEEDANVASNDVT